MEESFVVAEAKFQKIAADEVEHESEEEDEQ
jgi:hypothetical protein